MPYIPPNLRTQRHEEKNIVPKIATTTAEAHAMSKALMNSQKSPLATMLNTTFPKQKRSQKKIAKVTQTAPLSNLHAAKPAIISASSTPVASGVLSGMISPVHVPPIKPKKAKMIADPAYPVSKSVQQAPVVTINDPAFDEAMDTILRTIFEDNMKSVKRIASANVGDFTRRTNGSYKNERLESRFQGFKMQKLEEHAGKTSDALEKILRARFEIAMQGVKRIASAAPLDFAQRSNGAYVNERIESRFQGYLMASVNDFGLSVLRKIADNRVASLKTIR